MRLGKEKRKNVFRLNFDENTRLKVCVGRKKEKESVEDDEKICCHDQSKVSNSTRQNDETKEKEQTLAKRTRKRSLVDISPSPTPQQQPPQQQNHNKYRNGKYLFTPREKNSDTHDYDDEDEENGDDYDEDDEEENEDDDDDEDQNENGEDDNCNDNSNSCLKGKEVSCLSVKEKKRRHRGAEKVSIIPAKSSVGCDSSNISRGVVTRIRSGACVPASYRSSFSLSVSSPLVKRVRRPRRKPLSLPMDPLSLFNSRFQPLTLVDNELYKPRLLKYNSDKDEVEEDYISNYDYSSEEEDVCEFNEWRIIESKRLMSRLRTKELIKSNRDMFFFNMWNEHVFRFLAQKRVMVAKGTKQTTLLLFRDTPFLLESFLEANWKTINKLNLRSHFLNHMILILSSTLITKQQLLKYISKYDTAVKQYEKTIQIRKAFQ